MKMKAAARNALPAKKFALPAERKYPINDRSHQVAAKGRATQMEKAGVISPATASKIKTAASNAMHSDSAGSKGMHGDGKSGSHWSGR